MSGLDKLDRLTPEMRKEINLQSMKTAGFLMFVLLIIGSVALGGKMSGIAAGGTIVGISATLLLFALSSCMSKGSNKKFFAFTTIIALVGTILGSLALKGTLPISDAAWSVCGPIGGVAGISLLSVIAATLFAKCFPDRAEALRKKYSYQTV